MSSVTEEPSETSSRTSSAARSVSPSLSPPVRSGRKGSRKVRTGCITCKIRKVKCDEGKPFCARCVKTGRKCDGYRADAKSSSPEPLGLSPLPNFSSSSEKHSFNFYVSRSAKVLSGTLGGGFWDSLVLKLCATEPAVRHSVLAISSLHECVEARNNNGIILDQRFAFREYGKAINSLRNWSQRNDQSVVPLLVCVLFICIEFMADRVNAAQLHILQGRKMLHGLPNTRSPVVETIKKFLVPIYAHLSLASFLFGNKPESIPPHLRNWLRVPSVFSTLDEAQTGLQHIIDEGLQFSVRARLRIYDPTMDPGEMQSLEMEQQELCSQLSQWFSAFTIMTTMLGQSPAKTYSLNLLRVYHQATFIWISTALQPYELAYDAHIAGFTAIISFASSTIDSMGLAPKHNTSDMDTFAFETGVVAPLYWTIIKCRHPLLRRAALKLLTRDELKNRRENLWQIEQTCVVAARVIQLEEAAVTEPPRGVSFFNIHETAGDHSSPSVGWTDTVVVQSTKAEVVIPVTEYPSLEPPEPSFTLPDPDLSGPSEESSPATRLSQSPPVVPSAAEMGATAVSIRNVIEQIRIQNTIVEPPFGLSETCRIKNGIIGARDGFVTRITYFRDPEPGSMEWDVKEELIMYED